MSDDIKEILKDTDRAMQRSIEAMENDFHSMRTGEHRPHWLRSCQWNIMVQMYSY